jgi:hypothetical protein
LCWSFTSKTDDFQLCLKLIILSQTLLIFPNSFSECAVNYECLCLQWNELIICPVYKKVDRLNCNNYIPITLLNIAYKVFAILLNKRLTENIENKLEDNLIRFRPNISTIGNIFITLFDIQLDAQNSYLFTYNTFIKILYMFWPLLCSSSGGLRRNCIYAASDIIKLCTWLSCAPLKKKKYFYCKTGLREKLWAYDCVLCIVVSRFTPKFMDILTPNAGSRTVCELSTLEKWGLWRNEVASVSRFRMMMSAYVRRNSYMLETVAWEGRKWRRTLLIAVTLRMDHIKYMASLLKRKLLTKNLLILYFRTQWWNWVVLRHTTEICLISTDMLPLSS